MARLLYLQASPRGAESVSARVAGAFIATYQTHHPDVEIDSLDLFAEDLPPFDHTAAQGKYAIIHGTQASPAVQAAFARVVAVIDGFRAADLYVFAVPMWNFGIPYRLKHYLDLVIQPTYTFAVAEGGYAGLLHDKRAVAVYARGGDYEGNDAVDFQKRYLEFALGFMGIQDVTSIVVQPTLAGGPATAQERIDAAVKRAQEIAATL